MVSVCRCIAGFLAVMVLAGAGSAGASQEELLADGKDEYVSHCIACHGEAGRGDGPMTRILMVPPSDLTRIAENSDGQFPFWRIYAIISGEVQVQGHETFQMPQFWDRFRRDEAKPGYPPARVRILLLTHFLESLQAPAQ